MALYCSERAEPNSPNDGRHQKGVYYPELRDVFANALSVSPDRGRGVSFDSIAKGVEKVYGDRLASLGREYQQLPNDAAWVRDILRRGSPAIVGYQVNYAIDEFHRYSSVCEECGFTLPDFSKDTLSISGHAVLLLGFDFGVQSFIARNSWGQGWGVDGHFLLPFRAVNDPQACTDLWALVRQHSTRRESASIH